MISRQPQYAISMGQHRILGSINTVQSHVQSSKHEGRVEDPRLPLEICLRSVVNRIHRSTVDARIQSLHVIGEFAVATRQTDEGGLETLEVSSLNGP